MAIDKFDIDTIPTLVKTLDTDETEVTVTVYDRVARTSIALDPSPAYATQYPADSGSWYWDVAFSGTVRPTTGSNQYEAFMVGTDFGQRRRIMFDWVEDIDRYGGEVHMDLTLSGGVALSSGLPYVGTYFRPVSNLDDALTIAARINTNHIYVKGALTLDTRCLRMTDCARLWRQCTDGVHRPVLLQLVSNLLP